MIRLLDAGLMAIALWLAVLLTAGEVGGWAHVILLAAFLPWGFAIGMMLRRRGGLRSRRDSAEYDQEVTNGRER